MIKLSRLCFSDSGYYYDDKKDAKKLDSGYYQYVYMKKIFAGLKSLNSTLNQLYLKKAPEEISDQHQKQRNIYHNLTLFKTIFNYNVHPRGCTDSNVRIIYQVKRFLF